MRKRNDHLSRIGIVTKRPEQTLKLGFRTFFMTIGVFATLATQQHLLHNYRPMNQDNTTGVSPLMGKENTAVLDPSRQIVTTVRSNPKHSLTDQRLYSWQFAVVFAAHLSFVVATTLLTHYARWVEFLGGSVRDVGLVLGTGAVVALVLRPFVGPYIDRLGARNVWIAGLAIFLFGVWGSTIIAEVNLWVHVTRVLILVGQGLVFTSGMTYVSQMAPAHRQTEAFSVYGSAGLVAMCIGPNLGDFILGDDARTSSDFGLLFGVVAGCAVASAVLLVLVRPHTVRSRQVRIGLLGFIETVRKHWPGAVLVTTLAFSMAGSIPFGFLSSYVDAVGISGRSFSGVGAFFLAYGGWGLFVRLSTRRVADRVGRRKVLMTGLALTSLGMFSFLLVDGRHDWLILVPGIICGSGHALCFPSISALTLSCFPENARGGAATLSLMVCDFGMVTAAPIFGIIADKWGYQGIFVVAGVLSMAAAVYFYCVTVPIWRERRLQPQ